MQKLVTFIFLVLAQYTFCQNQAYDIVFRNVNIVSMKNHRLLLDQNIAISKGKIMAVESAIKSNLKGIKTIDLKGKFIMPSLADAHVHLPDEEKDLEKYLILNLVNGVTKLRSMRGDEKHFEWKKKYNTATSIFPKMYLSAKPIHRSQDYTGEELREYINNVKNKFDFIKILSVKSQDVFIQLDKLCKENNLKMAGHFPSNISDDIIFDSNLNSIEHLDGLIGNSDLSENRIKSIINRNIFICPTLRWYEIAYGEFDIQLIQKQNGIEYINKKLVAEWVDKTLKYREKIGEKALKEELDFYAKEIDERLKVIKRLNQEGVKLLLSPDSSSKFILPGFGIMDEIKLYKKAGLSNFDVLKAGTINFANYFNDDSYGTIEIGKNADFLLLNDNPLKRLETLENIDGIFFNNNYLDKNELKEISRSILPQIN